MKKRNITPRILNNHLVWEIIISFFIGFFNNTWVDLVDINTNETNFKKQIYYQMI